MVEAAYGGAVAWLKLFKSVTINADGTPKFRYPDLPQSIQESIVRLGPSNFPNWETLRSNHVDVKPACIVRARGVLATCYHHDQLGVPELREWLDRVVREIENQNADTHARKLAPPAANNSTTP